MKARILETTQEKLWKEFLTSHPLATIHQTPEWGHFQRKIPQRGKYWIVVLEEEGRITGGTLLVKHQLPKGLSWLYAPRGPLLKNPEQLPQLLEAINSIAKTEKAVFLRVDPPEILFDQASQVAQPSGVTTFPHHFPGFHQISHGFQPEHTIILDLTKTEEEILRQMKPKGRYNIRLAEKKGIIIQKSTDIGAFYTLLQETTSRDQFSGHDLTFYQSMLQEIPSQLYLAHYKNEVLAGIIVTYFKDTATYYFGASSNQRREFMAPYLIQWQAIKDAKAMGCTEYDLFGIAPAEVKNHPWQGVTEFKQKFGGQTVAYQKAQEFAFNKPMYAVYRLYKQFK